MSDGQLKSLAERIELLMDERDGIQSDIRDIFTEAKSAGYVPKVLRKAITRKRMDAGKRDEEDAILELYEGALDAKTRKAVKMAREGATARQIEAETGMDHATVARSVALNKKAATGEITQTALDTPCEGNVRAENEAASGVPLADRLNANSIRTKSGCLEWTGPKDGSGYGREYFDGKKKEGAHRVAWILANGDIPAGVSVCHRCDNPACIDPAHMFLGTQAENFADMFAKGRNAKGERTPQSKLTEPEVREILADSGSTKELSQKFNVSECCIRDIRTRRRWQHLQVDSDSAANSDAAPEGCVDGPSVVTHPAETIVPPCTTPQADEVAALSVTPVPDEGVGAGTIPTREGEREDGLDIPIFLRRVVVAPSKTPEQLDERVEGAAQ